MSIRVVVAAEVCFYREGLATFLERQATIEVVGTTVSRAQTIDTTACARPDVLLLDMTMTDSLAAVRDLASLEIPVRIVALAVWETERDVLACAEAGVAGYVPREGSLADLLRTIESVARGELIVSPRIAGLLIRRVATLASAAPSVARDAVLTVREHEIVRLIDEGLSNKQIAARLGIEVATAKNHVHNILEKLQIHRRGQIAPQLRYVPRRTPADGTRDLRIDPA